MLWWRCRLWRPVHWSCVYAADPTITHHTTPPASDNNRASISEGIMGDRRLRRCWYLAQQPILPDAFLDARHLSFKSQYETTGFQPGSC